MIISFPPLLFLLNIFLNFLNWPVFNSCVRDTKGHKLAFKWNSVFNFLLSHFFELIMMHKHVCDLIIKLIVTIIYMIAHLLNAFYHFMYLNTLFSEVYQRLLANICLFILSYDKIVVCFSLNRFHKNKLVSTIWPIRNIIITEFLIIKKNLSYMRRISIWFCACVTVLYQIVCELLYFFKAQETISFSLS